MKVFNLNVGSIIKPLLKTLLAQSISTRSSATPSPSLLCPVVGRRAAQFWLSILNYFFFQGLRISSTIMTTTGSGSPAINTAAATKTAPQES
jgi:hypothetical protein